MTNRTLRSLCSHDKWGIKLYMGWRKPHNVNPVTVESHKRLRLRAEKRSLLSPLRMQTTDILFLSAINDENKFHPLPSPWNHGSNENFNAGKIEFLELIVKKKKKKKRIRKRKGEK